MQRHAECLASAVCCVLNINVSCNVLSKGSDYDSCCLMCHVGIAAGEIHKLKFKTLSAKAR